MTIYDRDIDKINQLSINLEAPFAVMARFMSQIEAPESEQITDNQLQKSNDQVTINGNKISKQEFLNNLNF